MSRHRTSLVLVCSFTLLLNPAFSQQATPPTVSASSLLQSSLIGQVGKAQITDITLSGILRRIVGSDDETGIVTLQALSGGYSKIQLTLPSGSRAEIHTLVDSGPDGAWSGPDGVSHPLAQHNLICDPGMIPAFTLTSILSNSNSVVILIGQETNNGLSVIHLVASQQFPSLTGDAAMLLQRLSRLDIFLDSETNLPVSVTFSTHPDNNALLDIPVEVDFSDYRSAGGILIPFHIQKFLNSSLTLDLQFQSATVNSGLSASQFSVR